MTASFISELTDEEKDKYLIMKESQDMLHDIICHQIRGCSHTAYSQGMMQRLMQLDASIELLEISLENTRDCLAQMTKDELNQMLKDDKDLYKETFDKLH